MNTDELPALKINSYLDIPKNYTGIVEHADGSKLWYKNGKVHREDGPACEFYDGSFSWFLYGKKYWLFEDFFAATTDAGKEALIWNMDRYSDFWGFPRSQ